MKHIRRALTLALASVALLAAFAVPAAADFFGIGYRSALGKADRCSEAVANDPEFQPFMARLALGKSATLEQLSDPALPTDADAALVLKFSDRRAPCRKLMLEALDEYHPAMSAAYEVYYFQQDLIYVELIKKRIAFGEATKRWQESYLEFSKRYDRYSEKMEARERQQIARSLGQLADTLENYGKPPGGGSYGGSYGGYGTGPATQYTCRWIGPSLYCDPY